MRDPNLVLTRDDGSVYLKRWHVIPRNKLFNIYLHQFLGSDDDRALHDHPWWFASLVLKGGYYEHFGDGYAHKGDGVGYYKWRRPGSFALRKANTAHRVELAIAGAKHVETIFDANNLQPVRFKYKAIEKPAWTLIFTGPKIRSWGFHCPQGWIHWRQFDKQNGCE
ncbi:hypothetical protein SEA_NANOSMITE_80 [Mycobacterium phage Nanosmite]|nr:hypothetical protein SEA_NANOSMITE_80 [Mycobacterium phage Nanosmite]